MISNLEYFNGEHQYISDKALSYEQPNRLLSLSGSVSAFIIFALSEITCLIYAFQ